MFNPYAPYQQPYAQQYQPQQTQPQEDRIFVPNSAAAEAYLVAPGGFVRLWDSQKPIFYERQADAAGRQYPMTTYEYKKVEAGGAPADLEARIRSFEERLAALEKGAVNEPSHE